MPEPFVPPALETDPEVYAAVKNLSLSAIRQAQEILDTAIPSIKLQLIRSLLPQIAKSLSTHKDDDGTQEIKTALEGLYAGMTTEWGGDA